MEALSRRRSDFVLRPSVVAALVYFGLASIWSIWRLATATFPVLGSPEPLRLMSAELFPAVTLLHALLLVALLWDAFAVRRSPSGLRRAHWAGLAMALVTLSVAQLGAWYAHVPLGTPVSQNAPAQPAPHAPLEGGR